MKMPVGYAVLALTLLGAAEAKADDMTPLSHEEKAKVEMLLSLFDPQSYSVSYEYEDAKGEVRTVEAGKAVGLSDVKQTDVERKLVDSIVASTNTNNNIFRASTNTNNNIFRVASTNTNNNIFKVGDVASTNTNNNIFKVGDVAGTNTNNNIFIDGKQAAAARELNAVFADHYTVSATLQPMGRKELARVEELLSYFDPQSYSFSVDVVDEGGKVSNVSFGQAVGLATVTQTKVERFATDELAASTNTNNNIFRASTNTNNNIFKVGDAASTNTNNNIFRVASTNTNNNIFRVIDADHKGMFRVAATNTNNNIFVDAKLAAAAAELNELLSSFATSSREQR